jgi:hypothetical protein
MEASTEESGRTVERMAKESSVDRMEPSMKVSGLMANTMGKANSQLLMARCTLGFLRMANTLTDSDFNDEASYSSCNLNLKI